MLYVAVQLISDLLMKVKMIDEYDTPLLIHWDITNKRKYFIVDDIG